MACLADGIEQEKTEAAEISLLPLFTPVKTPQDSLSGEFEFYDCNWLKCYFFSYPVDPVRPCSPVDSRASRVA